MRFLRIQHPDCSEGDLRVFYRQILKQQMRRRNLRRSSLLVACGLAAVALLIAWRLV